MAHDPNTPDTYKSNDQLTGSQGNDKGPTDDPAENPADGTDLQHSQKAKKVDADPEEESKKPVQP